MTNKIGFMALGCVLSTFMSFGSAMAVENVFTNSGGYWDVPVNWSSGTVPVDGEDVRISANVVLSNSTASLADCTLESGKTITFMGTNTLLHAVMLQVDGTITHAINTDTNAVDGWQPDNKVQIETTNLTISATGSINVDAKGYKGGPGATAAGYGPGRGPAGGDRGASHGGLGTGPTTGAIYGSPYAPTEPGSGGAANDGAGGAGGGVVRLTVTENVTINGVISANGQTVSWSSGGGGSGGSIYITCRTVSGTNGTLRANGGWLTGNLAFGGMGGGGRVALVYDTAAQASMPTVTLKTSSDRGLRSTTGVGASVGTINLSGAATLPATLSTNWNGIYYGVTNWTTPSLTVSNALITFKESGFVLNVESNILVTSAQFDLTPTDLICGGNLTVTNNSSLYVRSGLTYPVATNFGGLVTVTGDVNVANACWIYPYSHNTNGASIQWKVRNLTVNTGGGINADGKGWAGGSAGVAGYGLGRGDAKKGGGYGGLGGSAAGIYGQTYGDSNAPSYPGSGGGGGDIGSGGGAGGGAIRIEASAAITINGTLTANGASGYETYQASSGSGGGIYLVADTFSPAGGVIRANGAGADRPGGGGGRIALLSRIDNFGGTLTAAGAGSPSGGTGTVVRLLSAGLLSVAIEGSPARHGTPVPLNYGANGVMPDDWVTISVNSPADESNGVRYACLGWTLKTDADTPLANGSGTESTFQVNTNVVLTWLWTNQFYLAASANTDGTLQAPVTGWYTNGLSVTITPVPDSGSDFLMWSGTGVPAGAHTNHPLMVTMDRERTIQANFASQTPGARVWNGTGNWFSPTNWSPAGVPGRLDTITIASGTNNIVDPTTFSVAGLTVNGQLHAEADVVLTVAGNTLVSGAGSQLRMSNDVFLCGGNLVLTNGASLAVYSGPANPAMAVYGGEAMTNYGALVSVGGTFTLATNTWVYPYSALQQKGSPFFRVGNLLIAQGSGFNADAKGYQTGIGTVYGAVAFGPGRGGNYTGGGYGGLGGAAAYPYGQIYGSSNAPVEQGSGGSCGWGGEPGGKGGGAIQIEATGGFTLNGVLSANGGNGNPGGYSAAGGSGGGIYVRCARLYGNGTVRANGGDGSAWSNYNGRPGGGGRIAMWSITPGAPPSGLITATVDPGHISQGTYNGGVGTVVWGDTPEPGFYFLIR